MIMGSGSRLIPALNTERITLDPVEKVSGRFFLPPDIVVMEIKANDKVPVWLLSAIGCSSVEYKTCQ